jgi:hypothetical protein
MDFAAIFQMGQEALAALDNAKRVVDSFKSNLAGSKDALGATELSHLETQLEQIHQKNLALSAELDDTMSKLQARG